VDARDISVFALAPQPLLIEFGQLLSDITGVDVRQLHREPKGWRWAEDGSQLQFEVQRPTSTQGRPALVIEISATVTDERITAAMEPDACIWRISVNHPHNDAMRRGEDLRAFRRTLRSLLNDQGGAW
jgi:hypothetical protein